LASILAPLACFVRFFVTKGFGLRREFDNFAKPFAFATVNKKANIFDPGLSNANEPLNH
jgi:hypothetical protein